MTLEKTDPIEPWVGGSLYLGSGEDYLQTDAPTGSVILRGTENWVARFSGQQASQAVKEEVQALFARWLRMQNFCVLMGAGGSYYVTKTLNAGLLDGARRLLKGRRSEKTLTTILALASDPMRPAKSIEQFLSQLLGLCTLFNSSALPLDKIPAPITFPKEAGESDQELIDELLLDLERAIAVTCTFDLPPSALSGGSTPTVTPHETFLSKLLARDPQEGRAKVFTTNYDTLLEQAMDRLGILYSDGFTGTVNRKFNPSAYDLDYYYPGELGEGRVRRYHKVAQLYKLHGSITWRRAPEPHPLNPYGIRYESGGLMKASQVESGETSLCKVFGAGEGLGILPTAAKYGQTLAMPFAHMFRSFGQALQQQQTVLFVIGYGGGDDHVNQMIHDALVNPGFTCVIVDPFPSAWAKRLCSADYCGRVYCVGGPWGGFEVFAEHLLPDLEALKTEIDVARTLRELRSGVRHADQPGQKKETEVEDDA